MKRRATTAPAAATRPDSRGPSLKYHHAPAAAAAVRIMMIARMAGAWTRRGGCGG